MTSKLIQNLITRRHLHCCHLVQATILSIFRTMVLAYVDDSFLNRLLLVIDDYKCVIFYLYHSYYFLLVGFLTFKRNFLIFTFLSKLFLVTVCTHGLFYYSVYYKPFLSLFILMFKVSQSVVLAPVSFEHVTIWFQTLPCFWNNTLGSPHTFPASILNHPFLQEALLFFFFN